jgi:hypothetical protein
MKWLFYLTIKERNMIKKVPEYIKAIKIKDIKTELKDGIGKLGLIMECIGSDGMLSKVEVSDIDLNLPELEFVTEDYRETPKLFIHSRREGYISFKINMNKDGVMATYKEIKRTVSKEQLEKELGYKLDIQ